MLLAAVAMRTVGVPGVEDGGDCQVQLLVGVLREGLTGPALDQLGVGRHQLLQVGGGELEVLGGAPGGLDGVQLLGEQARVDTEDRGAEHLHEAPVGVPGEAVGATLSGQAEHGDVVEPHVEDRLHHSGHGGLRSGAHRDQQGVGRVAEAATHPRLECRQVAVDLGCQVSRRFAGGEVGTTRFGVDRETWGDRQAEPGHLRQVRALPPEQVYLLSLSVFEVVHVARRWLGPCLDPPTCAGDPEGSDGPRSRDFRPCGWSGGLSCRTAMPAGLGTSWPGPSGHGVGQVCDERRDLGSRRVERCSVHSAICAFVCPSITPARTCCSLSLRRGRSSSHAVSSCRPTCSRVSRSIGSLPAPTLLMASVMSELRVSLTTYPPRPREDRRGERLVVTGRGQQQATDRRIGGSHCSADFDPGPVLQPEVQHHDVDPEVRDDPGSFRAEPGVTDDVDVDRGDQQVPEAPAERCRGRPAGRRAGTSGRSSPSTPCTPEASPPPPRGEGSVRSGRPASSAPQR